MRTEGVSHRSLVAGPTEIASARVDVLPGAAGVDGIQDAMAKLFVLFSKMQELKTEQANGSAKTNEASKAIAQKQRDEALAKAKDEGGFFKWIEKDIGLLGVAGLATFNYGLVGADLALHKSGLVDELRLDVLDLAVVASNSPQAIAVDVILRKLDIAPAEVKQLLDDVGLGKSVPGVEDSDVDPIVNKALVANMMVAGAATSILTAGSTTALVVACVGLALSLSGTLVQANGGNEWVALGLQLGGAACSIGSGFMNGAAGAGSALRVAGEKSAAKQATASMVAKFVSGTSKTLEATNTITSAISRENADEASIDAQKAKHALEKLERLLDMVIESLKEGSESFRRTTSAIEGALSTHNATLLASASLKG